jgi:GTP-binding protein
MSPNEIVEARFLASAQRPESLPAPIGVEIAFAGRSNVGKSSLLNRLMARRSLARTSSTPGCTRAINFFEAKSRDGLRLTLVDLPGYGYASRSHTERREWAELIEHYLLERVVLSAVAVLVDVRRGLEPEERDLLKLLSEQGKRARPPRPVLVATKLDRVTRADRDRTLAGLRSQGDKVVGFSTELPETTELVWRALRSAIT